MSKALTSLSGKILLFIFISLNTSGKLYAQRGNLVINGNVVTIGANKVELSVRGSVIVNGGELLNSGKLYITDSIINNSTDLFYKTSNPYLYNIAKKDSAGLSAGSVVFKGDKIQYVESSEAKTIFFHSIDINNPKGLTLLDSVYALGKVNPNTGSLFLNGKNLYLYYDHEKFYKYDGSLGLEKNGFKVWDDTKVDYSPLNKRSGHVIAKYDYLKTFPLRNLGFYLNSQSMTPPYIVERGHLPLAYAGDGSIRKYFVVNSGDALKRQIKITYLDSSDFEKLGINEPDLRVFLNKENSPINYSLSPGRVDIVNDTVFGSVQVTQNNQQILTVADFQCKNPPRIKLKAKANVCINESYGVVIDTVKAAASEAFYFNWYKDNVLLNDTSRSISDVLITNTTAKYKVMVYDNRGCFSYDSLSVRSHPYPEAGFKIDDKSVGYCLGKLSTFTDTSRINENAILTRVWSLNDGTVDTSKVVAHTYASAGDYNVSMISTSQYGCSTTVSKPLKIHPIPEVSFSFQQVCGDSSLCAKFINTTTFSVSGGGVKSAKWAFGANDTVLVSTNQQNPVTHCFATGGLKTVKLIVESNAGCKGSSSDDLSLVKQTVSFNASNACLGLPTVFTNTSVAQGATPSYRWNFGDGSSSNSVNPQKIYELSGTYEVTLVMQTGSCIDSIIREVQVLELPEASFSSSNACAGSEIKFSPVIKTNKAYSWNIAGSNTTVMSPVKAFTNPGTFNVSLAVTSASGCVASSTGTFEVYPRPKAEFTFEDVCLGGTVQFYNQSSVLGGGLTYEWSFEDDNPTAATNPSFVFAAPAGQKEVKLIATSNHSCTDTITKTVEVFPVPSAGLPTSITYCEDKYTLDATVKDPAIRGISYLWSNGSKQAQLTVDRDGTYSVDITSDKGCHIKESTIVTLNTKIDPKLPDNTSFCGKGMLDALYSDASCTWFKNGVEVSGGRYLEVSENGLYKVVVDDSKCSGNDMVNVTINPVPSVSLGNDITECTGTSVTLNSGSGFSSYQWSTGETSASITIHTPAKYKVTVINSFGCSHADTISVSYLPVPAKPLPQVITQCNSATIEAGDNAISYLWSTGSTGSSVVVNTSGAYWVKVSNGYQCFTYDTVNVTILHVDKLNLGNDISVCEGKKVILDAGTHDASYTYTWNRQTSSSSTFQVSKGGRYVAELKNTDNGCSSRDTVFVEFKSSPQVSLGNDKALCNALSVTLDASNPGSLYQWTVPDGSAPIQQTYEVKEPGKYSVLVMNPNGCVASDTIEVFPSSASLVADYILDSEVFSGDTVNFYDLSYPEPYTSMWDFGDGIQSTQTSPSHVFYLSDTFHVTLTVDNGYCTSSLTKIISVTPSLKKKSLYDDTDIKFIEILSSNLFPNPTSGNFTFEMTLSNYADVIISVFDLRGSLIFMEKADNTSEFSKQYYLDRLKQGIYIFKASVGKEAVTYKIVKF